MWVEKTVSFIRFLGSVIGEFISFLVACSDWIDSIVVFLIGPKYIGDNLGEWVYTIVGVILWLIIALLILAIVFTILVYIFNMFGYLIDSRSARKEKRRNKHDTK